MENLKELPIDKAARVIGSAAKLARHLGVSKGAVGQWKGEGRRVPPEHCPTIERLTREMGETVTCEELCPGVDWGALRECTQPVSASECQTPVPQPTEAA